MMNVYRRSRMWAAVGVACLTIATANAGDPPRYLMTVFGALYDGGTSAYSLNDHGNSTGESGTGTVDPGAHVFFGWPDGTIENVETLPTDISRGLIINNAGQIAGEMTTFPEGGGAGATRPFRYTPGVGMIDLGAPAGSSSYVIDMNEDGTVIGQLHYPGGPYYYESWVYSDANGFQMLGGLGTYSTYVRDINNMGQIVGYSWLDGPGWHAFVWENGAMTDLGTLGGDYSQSYYINDAGVIVGTADTGDGQTLGFRYTPGLGMEALPAGPARPPVPRRGSTTMA